MGGLPMHDHAEADDKIIAVLQDDPYWSQAEDLSDLPTALIQRLRHYFLTYKLLPGEPSEVSIGEAYGQPHAEKVIRAAIEDYESEYGSG